MNIQIIIDIGNTWREEDYDTAACYSVNFPPISFNVKDQIDLASFEDYFSLGELYYPNDKCNYVPLSTMLVFYDDVIIKNIKHVNTKEHGYILCLYC